MMEIIATFACGIFFGAALYISLVQHPATLETGPAFTGQFFPPMYRRWGPLHGVRTLLSAAAFLLFLAGLRPE